MAMMVEIKRKELTLVAAAAVMGLGYRQARRGWRRYRADSDAGLGQRARGRPSLRRKARNCAARRQAHRQWRERTACFGARVQLCRIGQRFTGEPKPQVAILRFS